MKGASSTDTRVPNIYRAIHEATGEVHYFTGLYDHDSGQYVRHEDSLFNKRLKHVIGSYNPDERRFDTLAEAIGYKGYKKYEIVVQVTLSRYGYTRIVPGGWDTKLGAGYRPWISRRRQRS